MPDPESTRVRSRSVSRLPVVALVLVSTSCVGMGGTSGSRTVTGRTPSPSRQVQLEQAEKDASAAGRSVLVTGRRMAIRDCEIVAGACWDYANAVYDRAGYDEDRRSTVFKSRKRGPYADVKLIQGGDWLYIVNHASGDIEHSVIFVRWIDLAAKKGLLLSYAGRNRRVPARYEAYDLSSVYMIIRPGPDQEP